jgi:hypothetical protein
MPTHDQGSKNPVNAKLGILITIVIGLVVGTVLIFAILNRGGGFTVVAQGQGLGEIKFQFDKDQVSLGDVLDNLLSEQTGSEVDSAKRHRLISNILQAHGFYQIPSEDAVTALRRMKETKDNREFMQSMRGMLYDLAGPFSRPDTFMEARDDRLLQALEDLYDYSPSSPLAVALWEMNLNVKGFFNPRIINATISLDANLEKGVAATCNGSPLLDKLGFLQLQVKNDDPSPMVKVFVQKRRMCDPSIKTRAEDLLAGKATTIWISEKDMSNLLIGKATGSSGVQAKVQLQAAELAPE